MWIVKNSRLVYNLFLWIISSYMFGSRDCFTFRFLVSKIYSLHILPSFYVSSTMCSALLIDLPRKAKLIKSKPSKKVCGYVSVQARTQDTDITCCKGVVPVTRSYLLRLSASLFDMFTMIWLRPQKTSTSGGRHSAAALVFWAVGCKLRSLTQCCEKGSRSGIQEPSRKGCDLHSSACIREFALGKRDRPANLPLHGGGITR